MVVTCYEIGHVMVDREEVIFNLQFLLVVGDNPSGAILGKLSSPVIGKFIYK